MSAEAHYRLHGVPLAVRAGEGLGTVVDFIVRYLRAEPASPGDGLAWAVTHGAGPAVPAPAEALGENDHGVAAFLAGDRLYLCHGATTAVVGPGEGRVYLASGLTERVRRGLLYDVFLLGLLHQLRWRGFVALHAAAVARLGTGVLFPAPGHSGKSTLALSLLHGGWGYLSDDLVLLSETPDGIAARGLFRHFRFDAGLGDAFPDLASHAEPPGVLSDKLHLDVDAAFPGRYVARCRPGLLLFPGIGDRAGSVAEPLSPAQALRRVLSQTNLLTREAVLAEAHLRVCTRLAAQAPAYRLVLGRDLLGAPDRVAALLDGLLQEAGCGSA